MSPQWLALAREAGLASEHIALGVAALNEADFARTSYYSAAFFSLSVGLERSAKLALVVDHVLENAGAFPSEKFLRSHGHDLEGLLMTLDAIAERRQLSGPWDRLPLSEIHVSIVGVLTDFASNLTRYYNLDLVTGSRRAHGRQDAMAQWHEQVTQKVLGAHDTGSKRAMRMRKAKFVDDALGPHALVRQHSETGVPITSVYASALQAADVSFARPYERMYVLQIARFIGSLMSDLTSESYRLHAEVIPDLSEFFGHFRNDDRYFRTRKTWSMHG